MGLARAGSVSGNGSGDLFIAFSTANAGTTDPAKKVQTVQSIPNDRIDPIFAAVVQAVDEALVNALVNNRAMTGRDGHHVDALPHERLQEALRKYNRLAR
jgi:L-aminopeptidase/D-esterase-like protein